MKPHKISTRLAISDTCYLFSSFFIGCLIELKFCEVSRNSISNWTWKFQLSILKDKKVLFLKKNFGAVVNIKTKKSWFQFSRRFWDWPVAVFFQAEKLNSTNWKNKTNEESYWKFMEEISLHIFPTFKTEKTRSKGKRPIFDSKLDSASPE